MRRCAAFVPAYAGESTAATVGHNGLVGRPATAHPSAARPLQSCTQRRSNMRLLDQHIKQRSTAWIEMELGAPGYSSKICQYRSLAWHQFFEGVALLSHGIVWSAVVSAAMKHGMGHNMGRHVRVLDTTPSALPSRDGVELRTATDAVHHVPPLDPCLGSGTQHHYYVVASRFPDCQVQVLLLLVLEYPVADVLP